MNVVERLHSQSIARNEQFLPALIPDREGKHAAQIVDAGGAVFFIEMENCLGIAVGAINVAPRFEVSTIICMIVDLAVVGDVETIVFIGHRLMAGSHVDDREAPMPERDAAIDE